MRMRVIRKVLFSLFIAVFVYSPPLRAEDPQGSGIGVQSERFQEDTQRKKEFLEAKKVKKPEIKVEEPEKKPPAPAAVQFELREIILKGATLFPEEKLTKFYQPYLNKKVSFEDLETIAERIKAHYFNKGYWTTLVFIPEQDIQGGKVIIQIAEGRMGELKIEGNRWFSESLVRRYSRLEGGDLLNMAHLQRNILRLDENSDIEIKAVVEKGEQPETSNVVLTVKDQFPWHLGVSTDNAGTRLTGKGRAGISLRGSNVFGQNDSVFSNTMFSGRSFGQAVNYEIPVNAYGTKLGFTMSYFSMRLGKEFKAAGIKGFSQSYTPYLSQELYLSENYQASVNAGLDIKRINRRMDANRTNLDELRLPYFGFDFSALDRFHGQTTFTPQVTFGTQHFLGASGKNHPSASRAGTGYPFTKYEQTLKRIQRMPWDSYAITRCQYQAASRTLPAAEQFQLGGINSVRGYPEGDYSADWGATLNVDWVFPIYVIPETWKLPRSTTPLRKQIEAVGFTDLGKGKLKKVIPGEKKSKFLMGVGGGFRVHLWNNVYVRFEWAKSVGDRPTGGAGPSTFHFAIQSEV